MLHRLVPALLLALAAIGCGPPSANIALAAGDEGVFLFADTAELIAYDGANLPEMNACEGVEMSFRRGTLEDVVGAPLARTGEMPICDVRRATLFDLDHEPGASHAATSRPWDPFLEPLITETGRAAYLVVIRDPDGAVIGLGCYDDRSIGARADILIVPTSGYNERYMGMTPSCPNVDQLCGGGC